MSRSQTPRLTLVAFLVGALALVLGYIGYRDLDPSAGFSDALYQSIRLFFLDYSGPPTDPPWQLEAARFMAAGFFLFTVSAVVIALAREQTQRVRIRLWGGRRHVLLIGLGERGRKIAERMESSDPVAIIERNPANAHIEGARAHGMPTLKGDARQTSILDDARVTRAQHVLIAVGDDSIALELLAACQRRLAQTSRPRTILHVALDDLGLWQQLHQVSLAREKHPARTEFVSIPDRIAERFVSEVDALPGTEGHDRVVLHGCGPIAVRTVVHSVRRSLLAGNRMSIVLTGPHAEEIQTELQAIEPWVASSAEIDLEKRHIVRRERAPTAVLVCGLSDAAALAAAAGVAQQAGTDSAPTYVAVPDLDAEEALKAADLQLASVCFVAAEADVLGPQLFNDSALELLARAKHDDYLLHERGRGIGADENPSAVTWEELPESLRESNRRFAESIGAKLGDLGAALVPLTGAGQDLQFEIPPQLLEAMAMEEHGRWVRDLEDDGWRFASGPKNTAGKLHPLLVPWAELSEGDREKDREAICALPKALATVGYALRLPVSSQSPQPGPANSA